MRAQYHRLTDSLSKVPLLAWVLAGFFLAFYLFFILPIFFDPSHVMMFNRYIPFLDPIGRDLRDITLDSASWFHTGTVPVTFYPPLTLISFLPFTFLPTSTAYGILTLIILGCYTVTTLLLAPRLSGEADITPLTMLVFVSGLISYGLQFELERGQWNIIAYTFCLAGVWIFHKHPRRRWLAYVLLSLAVQLKLYPAIFALTLIDDWHDWKNNLKRLIGLGLANVAALFLFGVGPVSRSFSALSSTDLSRSPWAFNLSVKAFALHLASLRALPQKRVILWLQANDWMLQALLLAFFAVLVLVILWRAYRRRAHGFEPYVFMACMIGALIIPSLSFDYKLALLPSAVLLLAPSIGGLKKTTNPALLALLVLLLAFAYSTTLFPIVNKPDWLHFSLPVLLVILSLCTVLACLETACPLQVPMADKETAVAGPQQVERA